MNFIYRVENKEKKGCYWENLYKWKEVDYILKRHYSEYRPTPLEDFGIKREPKGTEICGFKDLKQAKEWFNNKELEELKRIGYFLKKVKVKKITAIGEKQVLAIR